MTELPNERLLRRAESEFRWQAESHHRAVRSYVVINVAAAGGGLALLKMEGPLFADGIAAGLFVCGFALCLFSLRAVRVSDRDYCDALLRKRELEHKLGILDGDAPARPRPASRLTLLFSVLAAFHLASALATIWLTFIAPLERTHAEEDALASNSKLTCSRYDL